MGSVAYHCSTYATNRTELLHSTLDSIRKAREPFLIDLAGTLEPHRMNRPDEFLKLRNPYLFIYLFISI